jgi:hypothetical protein
MGTLKEIKMSKEWYILSSRSGGLSIHIETKTVEISKKLKCISKKMWPKLILGLF